MGAITNAYKILEGKPEKDMPLDNIWLSLNETEYES
jgi:hypothetical protein